MATLRWMSVPWFEVMAVEGTYEKTLGRVECGPGTSEFRVYVSLRPTPKPTVIHCSSGGDQQESEYKGHSPQVAILR